MRISYLGKCRSHGSHAGGQELRRFLSQGSKLFFSYKFWERKSMICPPIWTPCHVVKNQQLQGVKPAKLAGLLCPGLLSWKRSSHGKRQRRLQRQKMVTPANPASYTNYKVATLCCQNLPMVNQNISNNSVTLEVTRSHFEMSIRDTLRVNFFSACVDNL